MWFDTTSVRRRIEHAEAARHVVERRIEALGEQRHLALRDDRVEKRAAQTVGNELQADEERQKKDEGKGRVVEVADPEDGRDRRDHRRRGSVR